MWLYQSEKSDWFYNRPPKPTIFVNERFMAARHKEGYNWYQIIYKFSCVQVKPLIDRRRRGGERHRISGDTTGSCIWNWRYRQGKVGGATVERLEYQNKYGR